jgi:two-component system, OmpR family, sensor histidine kinase KdpD
MALTPTNRWMGEGLRWLGATVVTLVVSSLLVLVHANSSTAGIVYLVLVVWFATLAGRGISIYLACISGALFDYFFIEPRYTLGISGFQSWLSMVAFVVSCVVVSRVAERARRQTRQAEQRREDVERLYELNQEMMLHGDSADLIREIPRLVEHNFALDAVLLYVRNEDQLYSSIPLPSGTIVDALRTASAALDQGAGLLEGYTLMNLVFGMNSVGTLAWKPDRLSREVAVAVAAQVAIVITRAHAIEASGRLEAARSTDRLRAALIDSFTHELRTPLTAIRAAATTLLDGFGLDDASRTELATIVDEESSRLDSLIGQAMEVAEIESDGIRVRPEPLHTGTFLEQAVERSHADLASHRVTIVVQQSDDPVSNDAVSNDAVSNDVASNDPVWFDPNLIGRVLRHLLENAAHHTPENSRILLRSRRSPGRLEFLVEDDGPGIDPEDLPLIFEKFYRGRKHGLNAKGSGMGLAITRALLAAHGGSIEVESAPGRGTTFRFWIPTIEKSSNAQQEKSR